MKNIVLIFCLLIFSITVHSQKDSEPERIEKYIKKENGKFGLWDKTEKKWIIQPEYNKISGIAFSEKSYESQNRIFFKLWKENTFDLLRVTENTKSFKDEFEIWVKDISEINRPNIEAIRENDYSAKDYYNFMFYKQGGKWGWFVNKVEILRGGYFSSEENIVFPPKFDNPPVVTSYCQSSFYNIQYNNYILQVDSSNQIGLYSLAGYRLVNPGNYKTFRLTEKIDYKNDIFITTENVNGLLGYSYNGKTVPPAYKSVSGSKTRKYYYVKPSEFFDCILPDGTHEWRDGITLISNEEIKRMDAEEKKIITQKQEEATKKLIESTFAKNSFNIHPQAIIDCIKNKDESNLVMNEIVKWTKNGFIPVAYTDKIESNGNKRSMYISCNGCESQKTFVIDKLKNGNFDVKYLSLKPDEIQGIRAFLSASSFKLFDLDGNENWISNEVTVNIRSKNVQFTASPKGLDKAELEMARMMKTCNPEFFKKIAEGISFKNFEMIKTSVSVLGINTFNKKNNFDFNIYQGEEKEAIEYFSKELVCDGVPLYISVFKNGDIQIKRRMSIAERKLTNKLLKEESINDKTIILKYSNYDETKWIINDATIEFEDNSCIVYKTPLVKANSKPTDNNK